jgi:hypothetical protein
LKLELEEALGETTAEGGTANDTRGTIGENRTAWRYSVVSANLA